MIEPNCRGEIRCEIIAVIDPLYRQKNWKSLGFERAFKHFIMREKFSAFVAQNFGDGKRKGRKLLRNRWKYIIIIVRSSHYWKCTARKRVNYHSK